MSSPYAAGSEFATASTPVLVIAPNPWSARYSRFAFSSVRTAAFKVLSFYIRGLLLNHADSGYTGDSSPKYGSKSQLAIRPFFFDYHPFGYPILIVANFKEILLVIIKGRER